MACKRCGTQMGGSPFGERGMVGEARKPEVLLKDGVTYIEHAYGAETELEEALVEHVHEVFGPATLLFSKKKLKSKAGLGSVPDAFVLDLDRSKWFLVEVELARHPLYDHIVSQISRFRAGLSDGGTLTELKRAFYEEITRDPDKKVLFEKRRITEVYKTVSDILETTPVVQIVIDDESQEQAEVLRALPFDASATEFKTYYRGGTILEDHVHRFVPVHAAKVPRRESKKPGKREPEEGLQVKQSSLLDNHKKKSIVAFVLSGERHSVATWRGLLLGVCVEMCKRQPRDVDHLLTLRGRKRAYFSHNPKSMRAPRKIPGTSVYAETHLSANDVARLTAKVLKLFGHSDKDVLIEER